VAPRLLGAVLVCGDRSARIVEVEAYRGADDPASHAFGGCTARNATMFGPAGHLYVYRSYGIHWCANVVCGRSGVASAVLLRAAEPLRGFEAMRAARPAARRSVDLCSGPGKLCQALGIDGAHDGVDLLATTAPVQLVTDGAPPPVDLVRTVRVGISRAVDRPWRWYVAGDPNVSRPR
jgi:DNA-3-methyladenine glycosylase